MIVEKVLNNNVVVSVDSKSRKEVILMGSGIAFNKKIGQEIDSSKIEKIFVVEDKNMGNKLEKLINQIPDGIFEISHEIIQHASKELNKELDNHIYIALSDHIAFAVKRFKNHIKIQNDLLEEIRRIHKVEFKIALWAVKYINNKLNIQLPEDEAGFIALHIVNASYNETTTESFKSTNIIQGILTIIRYYFSVEFNEDDLNYDRLLTHLKYFSKRVMTGNQYNDKINDNNFLELASMNYPEAFECSLKIKGFMQSNYSYDVSNDELVYLTMHIHRVIAVLRSEENS